MSVTHTTTLGCTGPVGASLSASIAVEADEEVNLSVDLATAVTNQEYDWAIEGDNMQSLYILSDQAVTIKVNSTSVPDLTIALAAGVPYSWFVGMGFTNPLAGVTVTKIYVTNASGSTAAIQISCLQDVTV